MIEKYHKDSFLFLNNKLRSLAPQPWYVPADAVSISLVEEVLSSFGNPCPRVDGAYSEKVEAQT